MWTCAAFMIFNGVLAVGLRLLLGWENGRLDEKYGKVGRLERDGRRRGGEAGEGEGVEGLVGVGEENDGPMFRYVL
jgi:hypothetical protein